MYELKIQCKRVILHDEAALTFVKSGLFLLVRTLLKTEDYFFALIYLHKLLFGMLIKEINFVFNVFFKGEVLSL